MDRKWLLTVALVLGVVSPAQAGLIPNGDFETGDFTGWDVQTNYASVEYIDGSYRAVFALDVASGPGGPSAELLTATPPQNWGPGTLLQFDMSYSYASNDPGAVLLISVLTAEANEALLNLTQVDSTPLSGTSPTTTYTLPWSLGGIDVFATAFAPGTGSASLTVILDNFRIIPEPSTWVLAATALVGVPCFAARRRRR